MKKLGQAVFLVIFVAFALLALPFFIPTQAYIGQLEQLVSSQLKVPLVIGDMSVAFLPTPRLHLVNVHIGSHDEFVAQELTVVPSLSRLFTDTKVISAVVVDQPVIQQGFLDVVAGLASNSSNNPPNNSKVSVVVKQVQFNKAQLIWPNIPIPSLNVVAEFADKNALKSVSLLSVDKQLHGEVTIPNGVLQISLQANDWKLPVSYPFLLDTLNVEAAVTEKTLEISRLEAKLYHGNLHYSGTLSWDKAWVLGGKFNLEHLSIREPLSLVSPTAKLSGLLTGAGHFNASAKSAAKLADGLKLHFAFDVNQGVLYGFDLAQAATAFVTRAKQGGVTAFDEFSGVLDTQGKQYQLTQLKVGSGVLDAYGHVAISPAKALDGELKVQLKNSLALAEVPLSVSGTIEHPVVLPTKAAMAGAAIGTAILGPGVGTSVGVKASGAVGKLKSLFGGGK